MREQLTKYVELLFAGTTDTDEIQQEILQNTLDKYDDLVAQGKQPEAAYRLAISGIGDINEILGDPPANATGEPLTSPTPSTPPTPIWKKLIRAVAIFLYIICIIPLIVMSQFGMEILGLCGTLSIVAIATALMVIASGKNKSGRNSNVPPQEMTPQMQLRKAVKTAINTVCLVIYFVLSFATGAWYITWLVFPIMAAINGLVTACLDLKEVSDHEG